MMKSLDLILHLYLLLVQLSTATAVPCPDTTLLLPDLAQQLRVCLFLRSKTLLKTCNINSGDDNSVDDDKIIIILIILVMIS